MQNGSIGVTTENIFPIIKKFLYSDHEIFLREIISNAVDATQKIKTLASVGEFKGDLGDLTIQVKVDKEKGTITVADRGVGMTEDEMSRYLNQIAFSGAEEFVEKYKNEANNIIGHFGLGFYSSFMVSSKVDVISKSFKDDSNGVKWSCDGSPEFTMEEASKSERGTEIIMHIDDDNKEFLEEAKISGLLKKYCSFLPIPIAFGKKKEWKDGKDVETAEDNVVNNVSPAWTRKPSELKEEDYKSFYQELYPYTDEPLFHIHLNVDYPFTLTGILYFPKIKSNVDLHKNKIQLYCNQVFVSDSVEGIVPEFMTLLHGVIDSPDIPLNVSRSYLQSDSNVKKISSHITKKVADRLQELFKEDRSQFEAKWDDLKIFVEYGELTDEKFFERAEKFTLLKNSENSYFTLEEYKKLVEGNQSDKDNQLIYLYTTNLDQQYSYIDAAKEKGYDVLVMDGQLDVHFISKIEEKEKVRFVRVDSDVVDNLIRKEDAAKVAWSAEQKSALQTVFKSQTPTLDKVEFMVQFEALGANANPVLLTQNEYMRRMKEMSASQTGFNFYGEMPDSYNLVVNTNHPLAQRVLEDQEAACNEKLAPVQAELTLAEAKRDELQNSQKGKKDEEISLDDKEALDMAKKKVEELQANREALLATYAKENKLVSQLIDLALLSNNMLKGEALSNFVKRSFQMI
ncbi:MAG: molecular chaperone HtpG [Bacteroidales bacterium]|jgi:molecular chaperone HtpG|nr:molecular chaperone HtpG [Bacteroidales bacterium]